MEQIDIGGVAAKASRIALGTRAIGALKVVLGVLLCGIGTSWAWLGRVRTGRYWR